MISRVCFLSKKRIIVNGIPKHTKRTAQFFGCKSTKNPTYANYFVIYTLFYENPCVIPKNVVIFAAD